MDFEWDPVKSLSNFHKHGIDFIDATLAFQDPQGVHSEVTRREFGEIRLKVTALIDNKYFTVIYTMRGPTCRIISARKARTNERRAYDQGPAAG